MTDQTPTELGRFLRARREGVRPEDVGLPPGTGSRRTPGLRREEIAALAGVSIDYYTRLERGLTFVSGKLNGNSRPYCRVSTVWWRRRTGDRRYLTPWFDCSLCRYGNPGVSHLWGLRGRRSPFSLSIPHRGYPGKAEAKIVGSWRRYPPPTTHNHGTASRADADPDGHMRRKGEHPGCIPRPATLAGHAGQGKTSPRDHTRHPSPETAKHQATETAIKSPARRYISDIQGRCSRGRSAAAGISPEGQSRPPHLRRATESARPSLGGVAGSMRPASAGPRRTAAPRTRTGWRPCLARDCP
jgi:hypothetical protein